MKVPVILEIIVFLLLKSSVEGYTYRPGIRWTAVKYTTSKGFNPNYRFLYTNLTGIGYYSYGLRSGRSFGKDIRSKYLCSSGLICLIK